MKRFLIVLFVLVISAAGYSQFNIRAGMAINLSSTPSLNDYLNANYAGADQLGNFGTSISFSGEAGYLINESYEIGIEVAYMINSHTFSGLGGQYEMNYGILLPSIINYYVITGEGYNFKFGGGAGLSFLNADEHLPATTGSTNYSSTGFGFILKADGNTALGENLYANIGGIIRYVLNGEPENTNGNKITYAGNTVNFNMLSLGLRLGLTYYF